MAGVVAGDVPEGKPAVSGSTALFGRLNAS